MVITSTASIIFAILCNLCLWGVHSSTRGVVVEAFIIVPAVNTNINQYCIDQHCHYHRNRQSMILKFASSNNNHDGDDSNNNNNGNSSNGYRFGDMTRGVFKKVKGDVSTLRGNSKNDSSSSYEFGDISRWLDTKAKEQVGKFTNNKNYKFGDISKELIRRFRDGEYTREDILLFIKIAATIGINLQPVARILPMKVLMDLLNLTMEASIAKTVGDKMITSLTTEIDGRMKEFVTGDRNYKLGDYTSSALSKLTGKEKHGLGDLTATIVQERRQREQQQQQQVVDVVQEIVTNNTTTSYDDNSDNKLDPNIPTSIKERDNFDPLKSDQDIFDEWDTKLVESRKNDEKELSAKTSSMEDNDEILRAWDKKLFLSASSVASSKRQ